MSYQEPELNFSEVDKRKTSFRPINNFKLKDGPNIFRILPPFGTGHNGVWFADWSLHWGFQNEQGKNVPLACSYRTQERYCPICEESRDVRKKMDKVIAPYTVEVEGRQKTDWDNVPQPVKDEYTPLKEKYDNIRAQRHYYYNAVDQNGELGVLKITARTGDDLNDRIKEAVLKKDIKALSLDNGCYFNVNRKRTGKRTYDVKYEVDFVREAVEGEAGLERLKMGPLPQAFIANFADHAYDIHALYTKRTAAELMVILKTGKLPASKVESEISSEATTPTVEGQAPEDEQLATLAKVLDFNEDE